MHILFVTFYPFGIYTQKKTADGTQSFNIDVIALVDGGLYVETLCFLKKKHKRNVLHGRIEIKRTRHIIQTFEEREKRRFSCQGIEKD